MSSFCSKIVKNAIKIGTFYYRKNHLSLSRNVKIKNFPYKVPKNYCYEIIEIGNTKIEKVCSQSASKCDFAIVQFHGGGHTQSINNRYRRVAEKLCKISNCAVYSIDYKNGKNLVYPSVHNECYLAYLGLINGILKNKKVVAIGDSFGVNLMLSTCLKLRDGNLPMPSALICISSYIDLANSGESYKKNCYRDPSYALPKSQKFEENEKYIRRITPYCGNTLPYDCMLSPVYAEYKNFPKMLIQCGDLETSESDNEMLYKKAMLAKVDVIFTKYEGMWHDFQYFTPFLKECKLAWKEIEMFVKSIIK